MQSSDAKKTSHQGKEDWHPADIIAALRKAGYTLSKLAFEHGLKDSSGLSKAMNMSFPLGEKRIADALKIHPKEIWPTRYEEDGSRKPAGIRAIQCTAAMRARNVNPRKAA
jgi:Ner family transcriptional regulator